MQVIFIDINEQEIKDGILQEIIWYLTPKFQSASFKVLEPIKDIIRNEIFNSTEFQRMTPGSLLYHQLGVPDIEQRLRKVVEMVVESINVQTIWPKKLGDQIYAQYLIQILKKDLSDILSLPEGVFTYYSERQSTEKTLNWLEWMLTGGTRTIILDYHFAPVNKRGSRTGFGLMFGGGSWSIDPSHSGTINDNFLTRALNRVAYVIIKTIEREFLILDT